MIYDTFECNDEGIRTVVALAGAALAKETASKGTKSEMSVYILE